MMTENAAIFSNPGTHTHREVTHTIAHTSDKLCTASVKPDAALYFFSRHQTVLKSTNPHFHLFLILFASAYIGCCSLPLPNPITIAAAAI